MSPGAGNRRPSGFLLRLVRVAGRASATHYTVTLGNIFDNVDLRVYDAGDHATELCGSNELGTADDVCAVRDHDR